MMSNSDEAESVSSRLIDKALLKPNGVSTVAGEADRLVKDRKLDEALEETFPASDPIGF